MSYALTIGSEHVLTDSAGNKTEECDCHTARELCAPSFVFSVEGQIGFRTALEHLSTCRTRACSTLKGKLHISMREKLNWLYKEGCLLGCVHIQPVIYGARKATLQKKDFSAIAHHLSRCPKESCAQLRRAVLLTIRDDLRVPQP